jgi:hypothetical protein
LTACPGPETRNYYSNIPDRDGGQHGGGGKGQGSAEATVRGVIGMALRMLGETDPRRNPVMRFAMEFQAAENLRLELLFPKLPSNLLKLAETKNTFNSFETMQEKLEHPENFASPALKAVVNNPRTLKVNGPCPEPENKDADGSVTELNLSGELCLSVGNFTRLPDDILLASILGVLVHEAVHLAGAEEREAREWQTSFDKYLKIRFASFGLKDIANPITFAVDMGTRCIDEAGQWLNRAPEQALKNVDKVKICAFETIRNLSNIPSYWDPIELQLYIRPAHPEYVYFLSNAIIKTMEDLDRSFDLGIAPRSMVAIETEWSPPVMGQRLGSALDTLNRLRMIFDAYKNDGQRPEKCFVANQPKFYISNPRLNRPSPTLGAPFLPPQTCEIKI